MKNQRGIIKSKRYCSRCGSFDLMKSKRGLVAKYIFNEPRKLHCQACNAKFSFQKIASNRPLIPPRFHAAPNASPLPSKPIEYTTDTALGESEPKGRWSLFGQGLLGGLMLFAVLMGLFLMSPYSKSPATKTASYAEPALRLSDVDIVRLEHSVVQKKNNDIEIVLVEEPKKMPSRTVWEDVDGTVTDAIKRQSPEQLTSETIVEQSPSLDLAKPIKRMLQDLDRLLTN